MRLLGGLLDTRPLSENPRFRRLWLGSTASGFGSQFGAFAVTFYVWESTHSTAMVGLIGLFIAAPMITVALLGSAFADHVDRRKQALATTWGQIAASLAMTAVAVVSRDAVWTMLLLTGVSSGLAAISAPARRAFVPSLLSGNRLAAGLALNHLSFQLAMLLGPALAGMITAQWGTAACFAIDAVTFVAALTGLYGLPATVQSKAAGPSGLPAVLDGLRFAVRTPAVRGALLCDVVATLFAMPMALFPAINEEKFGGAPETLGLLTTAVAVGGVLASALSGYATRGQRPGLILLGCGAVWGVSLAAIAATGQFAMVFALLAVAGAADTWAVVSRGTVVQSSTPESHRGRIASLEYVVGAAVPHLGNLRAGLVAAGTSGGAALAIGGLSCVAGIGLIGALTPRLRRFTVPATSDSPVTAGTGTPPAPSL